MSDRKITRDDVVAWMASITDEEERKKQFRQAQMLAANAAPPEAFLAPIRTAREYLAMEIEIPPIVIGTEEYPVLVRGGLNARIARAGKGKTVGTMNQFIRWAAGLPWFDDWVDMKGNHYYAPMDGPVRTLVIENEGAGGLFHKQLNDMFNAGTPYLTKEQRETALDNMHVWGDGGYAGIKLDDEEKLRQVREGVEQCKPDLVLIEPFRGLWNGDENSSTDMGKVADALVELAADFNCAVLITHHENKSGGGEGADDMSRARGSTVLEGVVSTMEIWQGVQGDDYRELSQAKNRYGKKTPPVRVEWDGDAWWYSYVPDSDVSEAITEALTNAEEPMTVKDLSEATGETEAKIRKHCKDLVADNKLKAMASSSNGRGSTGIRYRLPYENTGGLSV